MAVRTTKYVRKPLYVDAVQVTKDNFAEVLTWCQGDLGAIDGRDVSGPQWPDNVDPIDPEKHYIRVRVSNPLSPRQTRAFVGDWILYTDRGYKIYTPRAFEENFDAVPESRVA